MPPIAPSVVLFDLDGTLVDSAPDLAHAANVLRDRRGMPPMPLSDLRAVVGSGARGMVGAALGMAPAHPEFEGLKDEFLGIYATCLAERTHVFAGVADMLGELAGQGLRWGIVTNKAERFAHPLIAALGLDAVAATVVCGDTTPHPKPHPAPLLEAARRCGVAPTACWYVGDDLRDVQAGLAAGMPTVVAHWGYLGLLETPVSAWGADHIIQAPAELPNLWPRP